MVGFVHLSLGADDALAVLLGRLPAELGARVGEPVPLEGGITNRNFRLRLGEDDYVLRVPGKDTGALGIDRGAEAAATELAARVGAGPELVASFHKPDGMLTRFVDGRPVSAEELREPERIVRLAFVLHAFHDAGATLESTFDCFRVVEEHAAEARARGAVIPPAYEDAHARAREIEAALTGPDHAPVPIHADLLTSNVLEEPNGRLRLVDWEYAGMGHRFFDLGNLSINNGFAPDDDERLLAAYFGAPPSAARRAALALMRLMSDFREAMWGVVQSAVSTLDFDYVQYADEHFARLRETADHPDYRSWLRVAAA
jgi:thiamine kinase-like enzyme